MCIRIFSGTHLDRVTNVRVQEGENTQMKVKIATGMENGEEASREKAA